MNELFKYILCFLIGIILFCYSRYDFDGTFVGGKLNGSGILTISEAMPHQQNCIIMKSSVFNLPSPDKIEGEFQDGFITGIGNLTWFDLNIKMSIIKLNINLRLLIKKIQQLHFYAQ